MRSRGQISALIVAAAVCVLVALGVIFLTTGGPPPADEGTEVHNKAVNAPEEVQENPPPPIGSPPGTNKP